MTNFKPGDRVRVIEPYSHLPEGEYTVRGAWYGSRSGRPYVELQELANGGHYADRFELVESRPFKPGDRVRVIEPYRHLPEGEYTVTSTYPGVFTGRQMLDLREAERNGHYADRFELVSTNAFDPDPDAGERAPQVVVSDHLLEVVRDYDAALGDERRFDRDEALRLAEERVTTRGCRQQVRITPAPTQFDSGPLWLIQDVR